MKKEVLKLESIISSLHKTEKLPSTEVETTLSIRSFPSDTIDEYQVKEIIESYKIKPHVRSNVVGYLHQPPELKSTYPIGSNKSGIRKVHDFHIRVKFFVLEGNLIYRYNKDNKDAKSYIDKYFTNKFCTMVRGRPTAVSNMYAEDDSGDGYSNLNSRGSST